MIVLLLLIHLAAAAAVPPPPPASGVPQAVSGSVARPGATSAGSGATLPPVVPGAPADLLDGPAPTLLQGFS